LANANTKLETPPEPSVSAPQGRHLMGPHGIRGHDDLVGRVAASHRRNVAEGGCLFRPATSIQVLPGVAKFRCDMARRSTGEVVCGDVGFLILSADGRVDCDCLFTQS